MVRGLCIEGFFGVKVVGEFWGRVKNEVCLCLGFFDF